MPEEIRRIFRFGLNGLAATAIHYGVLAALVEAAQVGSVAVASIPAACCGLAASYCGNRRFVMRSNAPHHVAGSRFLLSYAAVILSHGGLMLLWADLAGWNYTIGFVVITAFAAAVTYLLNRQFVFRGAAAGSPPSEGGSVFR